MVLLGALLMAGMVMPVIAADPGNAPVPVWWDWMGSKEVIVACSDDCTSIAAGSDTGMFRMYNHTGAVLWTYPIEGKPVTSVAISDNGEFAAATFSTPHEGDIVYFNREGTVLWKYRSEAIVPRKVAMSKDGSFIVASSDKEITVFNSTGAMIAHTLLTEDVCRLVTSDDGATTVVAAHLYCIWRGMDGTISSMNQNGTFRFQVPINLSFTNVAMSAHGERIAGVDDTKLYAFTGNGTLLWNFSSNPRFRSVAISSDGDDIAAGSQYFVRFFNRTGALLWDYYDEKGWVNTVSMSGDGDFIFAGSSNKLLLFDRAGNLLWKYSTQSDVSSVSAAKDGEYFAAGTNDKIYFFNRWGNATIIDEPNLSVVSGDSPAPAGTALISPTPKPSPKPSPIPAGIIVGSLLCAVFLIARRCKK
jgi:WD40 repeat protein